MKKQNLLRRFRWSLLALPMLCATLMLTACGGDDDEGSGGNDINSVIPADIRNKMKNYITFYEGNNPPNVEGTYLASPYVSVYDSSDGYEAGSLFVDSYFEFYNQNSNDNTLYFRKKSADGITQMNGKAHIQGNGNNFTIYLISTGTDSGISLKEVTVVSGTKTASGIKNLHYAFVVTEKGNDPEETLVPVGTFRVFKDKDGLAENTTWPTAARAESGMKAKSSLKGMYEK